MSLIFGLFLLCTGARASELGAAERVLTAAAAAAGGVAVSFADPHEEGYPSRWAAFDRLEAYDSPELERFAGIFADAWGRYEPGWIRRTGLRRVAFVKNLVVAGTARAAMPDARSGTVFYDVAALAGDADFGEEVIHHELFHLAAGEAGDPAWTAVNPHDFRYGGGGASAYIDRGFRNEPFPSPGFVDRYAMTALEEDRAEIFGWMMTPGYGRELARREAVDSGLRSKVALTRQWIQLL